MTGRRSGAGFTTIEALVSFAILLLIMAAVLGVYSQSRTIFSRGERKADLQQNARFALAQIAREVRMAGYYPENLTVPPASPPLEDAIRIATDSVLAVYGDVDGTGTSNAFMFCLDGDVMRRTRAGVLTSTAYTCSSGSVVAEHVQDLRFAYYDVNNDPIPNPPTAPFVLDGQGPGAAPDMSSAVSRRAVRRVLVTVTTRSFTPGVATPQNFTLTSDVWMRNAAD